MPRIYDHEWAKEILSNYENSCARARNIEYCILEVLEERGIRWRLPEIRDILVKTIQFTAYGRAWRGFKKLCRTRNPPIKPQIIQYIEENSKLLYKCKDESKQSLLNI